MIQPPFTAVVPMLTVSDMTRALAFYEQLGFSALRYQGGDGYAFLERSGFSLHLSQSDGIIPGEHPGNGVYFYLQPGTAAALQAEFASAGVFILSSLSRREWRMNEFVIADPDANLLRFGEPVGAE